MKMTDKQAAAFAAARQLISRPRAIEIRTLRNWANGGVLGGVPKPAFTEMAVAEDDAIRELWKTLDGSSCWMSALYRLCNEHR
jgi:hypothetical protein